MQENKRQRRNANAWREVLKGFASSGLSVPGFCERESISEGSFYRWRSLLERGGAGKKRAAVVKASEASNTSAPFVELGTLPSGSSRLELRVDLGGGVLLTLVRG